MAAENHAPSIKRDLQGKPERKGTTLLPLTGITPPDAERDSATDDMHKVICARAHSGNVIRHEKFASVNA